MNIMSDTEEEYNNHISANVSKKGNEPWKYEVRYTRDFDSGGSGYFGVSHYDGRPKSTTFGFGFEKSF